MSTRLEFDAFKKGLRAVLKDWEEFAHVKLREGLAIVAVTVADLLGTEEASSQLRHSRLTVFRRLK
jgi:hypothetical protein